MRDSGANANVGHVCGMCGRDAKKDVVSFIWRSRAGQGEEANSDSGAVRGKKKGTTYLYTVTRQGREKLSLPRFFFFFCWLSCFRQGLGKLLKKIICYAERDPESSHVTISRQLTR